MPESTKAELVTRETLQLQPRYGLQLGGVSRRLRAVRFAVYDVVKRGLDLVLAAMLLVVLSPVFLVIAIAIKLDSPGPVIFRQKRTGRDGKEFDILKFRSMVANNDINDDTCSDKCTRVGKIIRKTSLDELPQFLNVLMGQMSFIGPRPWVTEYWTNMNEEERERGKVRPGITGLAAAKGRNDLSVFEKIGYDLEYVRNYSLWQDIKVILMTVRTVLVHEGFEAGKEGVCDDIGELTAENRGPRMRVVLGVDPLVSVMVSAFNNEKYVKGKISSVMGRDYERLELVIVDEGGSSEAEKMVKNLASEKIKIREVQGDENIGSVIVDKEKGRFPCFMEDGSVKVWRPSQIVERLGVAK